MKEVSTLLPNCFVNLLDKFPVFTIKIPNRLSPNAIKGNLQFLRPEG